MQKNNANTQEIEETLKNANIAFKRVEMAHGWIKVFVGQNAPGSISSAICNALNPKYGYMIATCFKI
jgi:hypothetical protein